MTERRPTSLASSPAPSPTRSLAIVSVAVLGAALLAAAPAGADPRADLDRLLDRPTPPGPGLDRAAARSLPWCGNVRDRERGWEALVTDDLETYHRDRAAEFRLLQAARRLCSAPGDPLARRAAAEIEQLWINRTGLAEADAAASLALRADGDAFQAERTALCDATRPRGPDTGNERHALAAARWQLFGCRLDQPLWLQRDQVEHLEALVDRGPAERDPLAHLAWVLSRQWKELADGEPDAILGYAVDQFDFHQVSADAALRELDAAPCRGNRYARVILLESLASARLTTARIEAIVARRARDPAWKELLITAPRMAAYFATVDALSRLGDQRPSDPRYLAVLDIRDVHRNRGDDGRYGAVIASVRKAGKDVHVTFAKVKTQVRSQRCVETDKIERILLDGRVSYREVCHDEGMVTRDDTPQPVEVPVDLAGGLRPGIYATFARLRGKGSKEWAIPRAVYADRTGKRLAAFYGFPLD